METYLQHKIDDLKQKNLFRQPKGEWSGGFVDFSSNDYLGLRTHPKVVESAVMATVKYGTGAGASRLAGGNHPLYDEFEGLIAAYKGYEAACVFGSGYLANIGVIQALVGEGDAVLVDRLSHACIIDGVRLSGAKLLRFKHNDVNHLNKLLLDHGEKFKKTLIVSEETFSMDGDKAPNIPHSPLLLDGAHSLYTPEYPEAEIYMGTMSKSLGSYGGYVCGSKTFIEYIKTSARSLIYSTALPPAVLAAAITALKVAYAEKPYVRTLENAKYLCSLLNAPFTGSAIIPIILGDEAKALQAEQKLKEQGLLVSAIRPPTVPAGTARLRVSISANHTRQDLDKLYHAIKEVI